MQVFQRDYFSYDPVLIRYKHDNGYSLLVNHKISDKLEAQMIRIANFSRTDWLMRPASEVEFRTELATRRRSGCMQKTTLGFFEQYNNRDRVYSEFRYSF